MEIPIGKIAQDVLAKLVLSMRKAEEDVIVYRAAQEGVKLLVSAIQEHAENVKNNPPQSETK